MVTVLFEVVMLDKDGRSLVDEIRNAATSEDNSNMMQQQSTIIVGNCMFAKIVL
jgi:hypothetical protein